MDIRSRRMSLNMTQSDLAIVLGVSRSALAMWETGKSLPRAELLPKIAQILNCSVDELLRGDRNEQTETNHT